MKKYYIYVFIVMILFLSFSNEVKADLKIEALEKSCATLVDEGLIDKSNENLLIDDASSYNTNCIYMNTLDSDVTKIDITAILPGGDPFLSKRKSCIIMQVAFNTNGEHKIASTGIYMNNYNSNGSAGYYFGEAVSGKIAGNDYFQSRINSCPTDVYYKDVVDGEVYYDNYIFDASSKTKGLKLDSTLIRAENFELPSILSGTADNKVESCADAIGEEGVSLLKGLKNIFMLIVPILLIVLASLDFATAIFSTEEGNMKKCQSKFIKRLIVAVIIFLVPSLLQLLLSIASNIWPEIDATMCGIFSK